jgi:membrane-associated protease RseP (regulator of RpoE activity)
MSETSGEIGGSQAPPQTNLEQLDTLVAAEFKVEETMLEAGVPTYYLAQPQETKQPFLRLLKSLEPMNLTAFLRRRERRIVLKIVTKPAVKPSNILINWILLFATIATTFVTGYLLSSGTIDPLVGGAAFTIAIMAVLGTHEMGHKLTATRKGIEATPPYFIPGPPPVGGILGIGTFGAVIMQKSLPPNRDALFDVGANGPIVGFFIAAIVVVVGFPLSAHTWIPKDAATLPAPLLFWIVGQFLPLSGAAPPYPSSALPGDYLPGIALHPVAFAGWVGLIVTMLNLLPAAMLDGGHIAKSLVSDKGRIVLTGLSFMFLVVTGFTPMALFVLFLGLQKHPGPLDDVSSLSMNRKLLVVGLIVIFVLSSFVHSLFFMLLRILGI